MSLEKNIRLKIESDLNNILKQLKDLEDENAFLKKAQQTSSLKEQFQRNFKILESKYSKQFKKYMKCLFKYGIYQSSLNNVVGEYNKIIDVLDMIKDEAEFQAKLIELNINIHDFSKISIQSCISKYGMVYENNQAIGENQMEKLIMSRMKRETLENKAIFYSGILNNDSVQESVQTDKIRSLSQQSHQSSACSSFWKSKSIIDLLKTKINSKQPNKTKQQSQQQLHEVINDQTVGESEISMKISTMKDQTTFSSQPSHASVEIVLSSIEPSNSLGLQRDNDMSSQIQTSEQSVSNIIHPIQFVRLNQAKRQFEYIDGTEINHQITERFSNSSSRNGIYSNHDTNKQVIEGKQQCEPSYSQEATLPVKQDNKQLETQRYIRKMMSERERSKYTPIFQEIINQKTVQQVAPRSDQKSKSKQDENKIPQGYHQFLNDQTVEVRKPTKSLYQPLQDRYINQNDSLSNKQELFIQKPRMECQETRIKPLPQQNLDFFSFDQEGMKIKRINESEPREQSQKKQMNTSQSSIGVRGFSPDPTLKNKLNETLGQVRPQVRNSFNGKCTSLSELLKSEDMNSNKIINYNAPNPYPQRRMDIVELDESCKTSRRRSRAERLHA